MGFGSQKSCSVAKLSFSFCSRCFPHPYLFLHFRTVVLSRLVSPPFSHPWLAQLSSSALWFKSSMVSPLYPRCLSCPIILHTHLGTSQSFAESQTHCHSRHCCHDLAGLLLFPIPTFNFILRILVSF